MRGKLLKVCDLVAREGVEPPTPAFSGLLPQPSVDSALLSSEDLPDFVPFIGAKMEPSCKKSEPAEICLDFDKPVFTISE